VTEGTSASFSDDALIVAQSLKTGERKTLIHGGTLRAMFPPATSSLRKAEGCSLSRLTRNALR